MKLFIDAGNERDIAEWLPTGMIDGVTSNPTILRSEGWQELQPAVQRLAKLVSPRPISFATYATAPNDMIDQAGRIAGWAENAVVKVPIVGEDGRNYLEVVHLLEQQGIRVNCTCCFSFSQAMLAAKAGASYVSVLAGRIDDEGGNGATVVGELCDWLERHRMRSQVIVGSARSPRDVQASAVAGAHCITVPPAVLTKLADHHYSRTTAAQFARDGAETFAELATAGARG